MKFTEEQDLIDFHFWSGGAETAEELTLEESSQLEAILEDAA